MQGTPINTMCGLKNQQQFGKLNRNIDVANTNTG